MTLKDRIKLVFNTIAEDIKAIKSSNTGVSIFPIWAEENSALSDNTYEWAFGNGANTPSLGGIVIPVQCELFAMTSKCNNSTSAHEIQIVIDSIPNATYKVAAVGGIGNTTFGTPLSIAAGTLVNFRTLLGTGTKSPNTVCAWFRTV